MAFREQWLHDHEDDYKRPEEGSYGGHHYDGSIQQLAGLMIAEALEPVRGMFDGLKQARSAHASSHNDKQYRQHSARLSREDRERQRGRNREAVRQALRDIADPQSGEFYYPEGFSNEAHTLTVAPTTTRRVDQHKYVSTDVILGDDDSQQHYRVTMQFSDQFSGVQYGGVTLERFYTDRHDKERVSSASYDPRSADIDGDSSGLFVKMAGDEARLTENR